VKGNVDAGAPVITVKGLLALRGDPTDDELVRAARRGDTDAFRALYDRHAPGLLALARSLVGAEEAEDVVQTAFVRAWDRLPKLRHPGAFKVWIRQTARRAALDELRRRGSRPAASLDEMGGQGDDVPAPDAGPEAVVASAQAADAVRRAVDALPEHHRSVVVLHHFDGLEVREVAEVLGVPLGTVLSRLARARETLQRKLTGLVRDGI